MSREITLIEFDPSTDWAKMLPKNNWLVIIIISKKYKAYFHEIIRTSCAFNPVYICSLSEDEKLINEITDLELAFEDQASIPSHLPKHLAVAAIEDNIEEGLWFALFSAISDGFDQNNIALINATDNNYSKLVMQLNIKAATGFLPSMS